MPTPTGISPLSAPRRRRHGWAREEPTGAHKSAAARAPAGLFDSPFWLLFRTTVFWLKNTVAGARVPFWVSVVLTAGRRPPAVSARGAAGATASLRHPQREAEEPSARASLSSSAAPCREQSPARARVTAPRRPTRLRDATLYQRCGRCQLGARPPAPASPPAGLPSRCSTCGARAPARARARPWSRPSRRPPPLAGYTRAAASHCRRRMASEAPAAPRHAPQPRAPPPPRRGPCSR